MAIFRVVRRAAIALVVVCVAVLLAGYVGRAAHNAAAAERSGDALFVRIAGGGDRAVLLLHGLVGSGA